MELSPRRPVRINCVLGNQFESSQLHHALCPQRVSCTLCQTARRFKGLARRFLRSRVSGCALARGFLVSALPVSASWKPFPGAESRERLEAAPAHIPRRKIGIRFSLGQSSQESAGWRCRSLGLFRVCLAVGSAVVLLIISMPTPADLAARWRAVSSSQHRPSPPPGNRFPAQNAETGSRASETGSQTSSTCVWRTKSRGLAQQAGSTWQVPRWLQQSLGIRAAPATQLHFEIGSKTLKRHSMATPQTYGFRVPDGRSDDLSGRPRKVV